MMLGTAGATPWEERVVGELTNIAYSDIMRSMELLKTADAGFVGDDTFVVHPKSETRKIGDSFSRRGIDDEARYRDHRDAAGHIGAFIDQVYNRQRLYSALRYQTPVAFEAVHRAQTRAIAPLAAWFSRDAEIYGDARCPPMH